MSRNLGHGLLAAMSAALLFFGGACSNAKDQAAIHDIMGKLAKGPSALTWLLATELKADKPEWDKVQLQSKEVAELAASMGKYAPPHGGRSSWQEKTTALASSAAALEKAAEAKDKEGALVAHKAIMSSCTSCHMVHRMMPNGS
jgi:hypothetical protein